MTRLQVFFCLFSLMCFSTGSAADNPRYTVSQTWTIGGAGHWDYLVIDPQTHLLYISRESRVQVVDTDAGEVAGEITDCGRHGVAIIPSLKKVFAVTVRPTR